MTARGTAPVRLGLIGTGLAIEKLHWPALRRLSDRYVVTAFADVSAEQGRRFADYSGVDPERFAADRNALLARDDVDAVLVSVPIPQLYEVARDALRAGKHVICEKPAGGDEQEAMAFLALDEEFPELVLMIAENHFYRDDLRHARALLDEGAIGAPHLMAWRHTGHLVPRSGSFTGTPWRHRPQYRGGVHLDAGVHDIAQIRLLCGEVRSVHAAMRPAGGPIAALSDITLNLIFGDDLIGNYTAAYCEVPVPQEPNDMRLYGTSGVLALAGAGPERHVTLSRADGSIETTVFHDIDNGYYGELCDFADALQHGTPLVGTVGQSVANTMTVLRAVDSAEQAAVMALDDLPRAGPVPLWRPRGAEGLFDGLPGRRTTTSPSAVA